MFGLLSTLSPKRPRLGFSRGGSASPIAVDLGSEAVRAAQITGSPEGAIMTAAGESPVAPHASDDFDAYIRGLPDLLREATDAEGFAGRDVVLSLPSSRLHWVTLRMPKLPADQLADAIAFEATDKLPFDASRATLRHEIAGEVHTKDGPRLEVLVSAARRGDVEAILAAAEKAKLQPVGIKAAPAAVRDGIARYYTRDDDQTTPFLCVDLGRRSTRAYVVRGSAMTFARPVDFSVDHAYTAAAKQLGRDVDELRAERSKPLEMAKPAEPVRPEGESFAMLGAALRRSEDKPAADTRGDDVLKEHALRLAGELTRCRQYHDATFAQQPIGRLVFFGGGAADQGLCREVAKRVGVAAQLGDFACRLAGGASLPGDRPNNAAWTLALGLAAGVPVRR